MGTIYIVIKNIHTIYSFCECIGYTYILCIYRIHCIGYKNILPIPHTILVYWRVEIFDYHKIKNILYYMGHEM